MSISVLIADDHPIFKRGLGEIIETENDLCLGGQASAGDEALRKIGELQRDVVILDIDMPGMSGLEAARAGVVGPALAEAAWAPRHTDRGPHVRPR